MKHCGDCERTLPRTEFTKRSAAKDGLALYCKECMRERLYRWRSENIEVYREINRRSRRKNISRVQANNAVWASRQGTPVSPWADRQVMSDLYELARVLRVHSGVWFEMDHVIPIRGANVCGLHVHTNLRLSTRRENARKGNHFSEENHVCK